MASQVWTYDRPRPALTVDVALFTVTGALRQVRLQALLIRREAPPFAGSWALPGGFVLEDEDLKAAAMRELHEETGVDLVALYQVGAIGTPGRDPRGHTVTVLWAGLVRGDLHALCASGDAGLAQWFPVRALPELAFDHAELLTRALTYLQERLGRDPVCAELLPEAFALSEFHALLEAVLQRSVDRRNFRRRVLALGLLEETAGVRKKGAHRPARLYRFAPGALEESNQRQRGLPF